VRPRRAILLGAHGSVAAPVQSGMSKNLCASISREIDKDLSSTHARTIASHLSTRP
jgi:hypothetical protein